MSLTDRLCHVGHRFDQRIDYDLVARQKGSHHFENQRELVRAGLLKRGKDQPASPTRFASAVNGQCRSLSDSDCCRSIIAA